jgi:hypothetical protein
MRTKKIQEINGESINDDNFSKKLAELTLGQYLELLYLIPLDSQVSNSFSLLKKLFEFSELSERFIEKALFRLNLLFMIIHITPRITGKIKLQKRVKQNASIDWTIKESVRAKLKVIIKRTLRQYGYPPDMQKLANLLGFYNFCNVIICKGVN